MSPIVRPPQPDDVDHLLLNARLWEEVGPYVDDAITSVNLTAWPTPKENEYLASMLAWEMAPLLPISHWFDPPLTLPPLAELSDEQVRTILQETIQTLFCQRIVLDFTDHLSDRALYCLLQRDILPALEKKIDLPGTYLHWDCSNADNDPETWLRYYASEEERRRWSEAHPGVLPMHERPPFPREMPRKPL
jgi:hypothetical protein